MNRFLSETHGMIKNSKISNQLVFPMKFNMKFNRTVNTLTLYHVKTSIIKRNDFGRGKCNLSYLSPFPLHEYHPKYHFGKMENKG